MPLLTPPPSAPQRGDKATFSDRVDAFVVWLINFVTELLALVSSLNVLAAGGAYTLPYLIDLSSTADADPTSGKLRFNSATQNATTTIYLDLLGSDGKDYTSILDQFDASTSTVKGNLRMVKMNDPTKFLTFDVTSRVTATGYRKLTLTNTGGSSANPFVNNDAVLLHFTRNGDKGDQGTTGAGGSLNLLAAATVGSPVSTIDYLNLFSDTYDTYIIELQGVTSVGNNVSFSLQLAVAGVVDAGGAVYSTVAPNTAYSTYTGVISLGQYRAAISSDGTNLTIELRNMRSTRMKSASIRGTIMGSSAVSSYVQEAVYNGTGVCSGFRISAGGTNNINSGQIRVYGRRNN